MKTKQERIKHLFDDGTGRTVIVPMDHGLFGIPKGIEDPVKALKKFIELKVDAVLMNFGIVKLTNHLFEGLESVPGRIMGVDVNEIWNSWKTPIKCDYFVGHCISATIEQAIKYNVDAAKIYFALGLEPELELSYIKHICEIVRECDKYDMPLMVEPMTDGKYIPESRKDDPKIIADGCRIAVELGADILKISYPMNKEAFATIVANSHVPILLRGGPKKGKVCGVLQIARDSVDAGAKGTIFGRNVWQRPQEEMERVVKALQDIVHRGVSVDETLAKYHLI